ncbi:MAG: helix-hairpin-helix domain-containing protein [Candidatus Hodarchaeales archaeon]
MPSICICLSEDPLLKVFSFSPGDRINIHVSFDEGHIPERYKLQILDKNKNSRLNRYGKGFSDIIIKDWPIPSNIREKHFGIWSVQVEDQKGKVESFGHFFFVEKRSRVEKPLLEGMDVIQIPEYVETREKVAATVIAEKIEEIPIIEPKPVELITTEVTQIKGLGKTYATRLLKLNITTVYEFYSFENRKILAETMRVTDKKLNTMLQDAKRILDQELEVEKQPEIKVEKQVVPSSELLEIPGIGLKTVQKLSTIGIFTRKDLVEFKELEELRKVLRYSTARLNKLLTSLGRDIAVEGYKPEKEKERSLDDPVINLSGIGKKIAEKLNTRGIISINDLIKAKYEEVKGITSQNRFEKWQKTASSYLSGETKKKIEETKIESELSSLPGIGPKKLAKINGLGIYSIIDLINYSKPLQLRKALRMSEQRFNAFIESLKGKDSN